MSTTVTYKGDTLATVSNATKTLKTAGKYMEGDVILTDVSRAAPTIQSLSITPSESAQTFNAAGVDGYKPVSVSAVSSTYVGSGIARKSSTDLTVSGATVTAPAGYYAEAASKSVTTMTLPTSTAASATSGYTSKATVGRSTSDQYINIAPGYNSAGGYYKISAVPNGSLSYSDWTETESNGILTMTIGKSFTAGYLSSAPDVKRTFTDIVDTTITPSTTQQVVSRLTGNSFIKKVTVEAMPSGSATAPASISGTAATVSTGTNTLTLTKTVSVTPSVTAGYVSSGTAGNSSVSLTASVTTQAAKTVTPTESEQTAVAANVYTIGIVKVGAISPTYIGSEIPVDSDLIVNGNTVTVPSGYYSTEMTGQVTAMTLPTSASSSATSGYTSKATISRSTSDQYINIPPGYNSTGGYYKINAVANGSATGPTSLSGSSATITTGTNTLTLTKTGVTTTPTVSAGYVSSATASTATVTLTASVTVDPTPTASGATVTIPAGYYSSQTTKSVTSGSASAPSTISGTSATVSTGTNTLTLTKTVSVTPTVSAGYVSAGTATNSSVSLTASVTTKAAAIITPTTTNQTIASGTYLTGTQTIAGDADLVGGNILSTANIFGVQGTVVVQNYYTGSSAPSSSLGSNGDIYVQQ